MLKFNKVLLASDFDNTLVYTQGALERGEDIPPMSARNREAVEYFIQNGGYFSISTGRALPAFARYAKDLPCNAPCVIANGAAIYDFNKDCYVAGEDLWIKVCVTDSLSRGSVLSKVAYVEISDTKLVYAQGKIDLQNGNGWGRIRLPQVMHTGAYQLTAYTRYMRNYPCLLYTSPSPRDS